MRWRIRVWLSSDIGLDRIRLRLLDIRLGLRRIAVLGIWLDLVGHRNSHIRLRRSSRSGCDFKIRKCNSKLSQLVEK